LSQVTPSEIVTCMTHSTGLAAPTPATPSPPTLRYVKQHSCITYSLLDKFSEKPLKIMWKVPGMFYCIFMGISPKNFTFQRPWKWETYEIPMKRCKI